MCAAYPFASGGFAAPVSGSFARQGMLLAQALTGNGPDLGASPDFSGGLERVQGADVFVVFIESYGAATYDRPALARRVATGREALAAAAAASGRAIASAFVESPTFGGASWLAHASLLAGVEVARRRYVQPADHAAARHARPRVRAAPGTGRSR